MLTIWTFKLSFDVDLMAIAISVSILVTFPNNWVIFFKASGHSAYSVKYKCKSKNVFGTNTLAYFSRASMAKKRAFYISLRPGANVIKLFMVVSFKFS